MEYIYPICIFLAFIYITISSILYQIEYEENINIYIRKEHELQQKILYLENMLKENKKELANTVNLKDIK